MIIDSPILYGLKTFSLYKYRLTSANFAVDRVIVKLFRTSDIRVVSKCQGQPGFDLLNVLTRRPDGVIFGRIRTR